MWHLDPSRVSRDKFSSVMSGFISLACSPSAVLSFIFKLFFACYTRGLIGHDLCSLVSDGGTVQKRFCRLRREAKDFMIYLPDYAITIHLRLRDVDSPMICRVLLYLPSLDMVQFWRACGKEAKVVLFHCSVQRGEFPFWGQVYNLVLSRKRHACAGFEIFNLFSILPSRTPRWVTCVRPVEGLVDDPVHFIL